VWAVLGRFFQSLQGRVELVTNRAGVGEGRADALPSPGVNPLEGSPKCSCGKLGLGRRSRLPTLERGRGLSWEPND